MSKDINKTEDDTVEQKFDKKEPGVEYLFNKVDLRKRANQKPNSTDIEERFIPISFTSFEQLNALEKAQEIVADIKQLTMAFTEMSENIFLTEGIEDKAAALQSLAAEFSERVSDPMNGKEIIVDPISLSPEEVVLVDPNEITINTEIIQDKNFIDKLTDVYKSIFGSEKKEKEEKESKITEKPLSIFNLWENKETGQTHWLATYSNNIIDKEQEIISAESHRRFVDLVDTKEASLPELWLWHRPEWKWGEATNVAYDENGFAIAMGIVNDNPAAKEIAHWIKERDDILVSHGMPKQFIKRDEKNKNIITKHITTEISPLPNWAAANDVTYFAILKESTMRNGIPDEKRQELLDSGISPDALTQLETSNEDASKEADNVGLARKEIDEVPLEDLANSIKFLTKEIIELQGKMQKLEKAKVEKELQDMPVVPLLAQIQSMFNKENSISGPSIIPQGPIQTQPEQNGLFIEELGWLSKGDNQ